MKVRKITVLLMILASTPTFAWHSYDRQKVVDCQKVHGKAIDHLIPPDFMLGGLLEFNPTQEVSFVIAPAFANRQVWQLINEDGAFVLKQQEYLSEANGSKQGAIAQRPITTATAQLILDIWINELRETRYPRCNRNGLDGVSYAFTANAPGVGELRAETWSPKEDLPPLWIAEAGLSILEFIKTPTAEERKLQLELKNTRGRLFQYLNDHGVAEFP